MAWNRVASFRIDVHIGIAVHGDGDVHCCVGQCLAGGRERHGDTAIGPKGAALTPRFVAGPYTYRVLEGVSHWIPDEAPEQLDALLARHFDTAPTHGN